MKNYLLYLLYELIPGLFKGTVRFCSETFTFIKECLIRIILILAILYFFNIAGIKTFLDKIFYSVQQWFF